MNIGKTLSEILTVTKPHPYPSLSLHLHPLLYPRSLLVKNYVYIFELLYYFPLETGVVLHWTNLNEIGQVKKIKMQKKITDRRQTDGWMDHGRQNQKSLLKFQLRWAINLRIIFLCRSISALKSLSTLTVWQVQWFRMHCKMVLNFTVRHANKMTAHWSDKLNPYWSIEVMMKTNKSIAAVII